MNAVSIEERLAAIQSALREQAQASRRLETALARVELRLDHPSRSPKQQANRTLILDLLPVAYAAFEDRTFTVRDLHEFAEQPEGEPLREALKTIGSTWRLGRLLADHEDARTDTLQLTFVRKSHEGVVWRITSSHESLTP